MQTKQNKPARQSGRPTRLIIILLVLFLAALAIFGAIVINLSQAKASAPIEPAATATLPAFLMELPSLTPPIETPTLAPTETEIAFPTEVDTPIPEMAAADEAPTPELIIPVTGGSLREEQAAAFRQWVRIGLGILALALIGLGVFLRLKHK